MTVLERLEDWQKSGAITPAQYSAIAAIVRKDRVSLFVELHVLLYLGVASCIAGLGWTINTYFENLGDGAILVSLTLLCGAAFHYAFTRALPFSPQRVESPSLVFDYVLYLGALAFAVELGYIEFRFELLKESWDHYLLLSSVFYFFLAYRFDNRFVLSLALSTLAGWFGLSFYRFGLLKLDNYRPPALAYAAVVAWTGIALWRKGLKPHFLRTYLHIAANVTLVALVSGVVAAHAELYLSVLLVLSGLAVYAGFRYGELAFAAYGTIYGYIGASVWLLRDVSETRTVLVYLIISGALVIAFIAWLAARGGHRQ
jgi:hypothetical protein